MSLPVIKYCPSTLAKGFNTYSPTACKRLFFGKKVNHILSFSSPQQDKKVAADFRQNRKVLSISGYQVKQSLRLRKNQLTITQEGEQGQYILKPIPHRETFGRVEQLPANEHLTMQIASQVIKMKVAENALVFFANGEPAYLTKRFDVQPNGNKIAQEDFATLMERTRDSHGEIFKNETSYEAMAKVMKKYVVAYAFEIEKYFTLVVFNYITLNGDAHLKNFSLQMTDSGDYVLSPAYDLINTRIHIENDTAMALTDGLFHDDYYSESYEVNGFYAYDDFFEFGLKIGMKETRIRKILESFITSTSLVKRLIERSYLNTESKKLYLELFESRVRAISYSYGKIRTQ